MFSERGDHHCLLSRTEMMSVFKPFATLPCRTLVANTPSPPSYLSAIRTKYQRLGTQSVLLSLFLLLKVDCLFLIHSRILLESLHFYSRVRNKAQTGLRADCNAMIDINHAINATELVCKCCVDKNARSFHSPKYQWPYSSRN